MKNKNAFLKLYKLCHFSILELYLNSVYTTYEYGTDRVFRNVRTQNSDAGESREGIQHILISGNGMYRRNSSKY
jgi:hypothetical protein